MKQYNTTLEKSHSKKSNALLTMLCILTSIIQCFFWTMLALCIKKGFSKNMTVLLILSLLCMFFSVIGFKKFKR